MSNILYSFHLTLYKMFYIVLCQFNNSLIVFNLIQSLKPELHCHHNRVFFRVRPYKKTLVLQHIWKQLYEHCNRVKKTKNKKTCLVKKSTGKYFRAKYKWKTIFFLNVKWRFSQSLDVCSCLWAAKFKTASFWEKCWEENKKMFVLRLNFAHLFYSAGFSRLHIHGQSLI